jgi:hypothetical protein
LVAQHAERKRERRIIMIGRIIFFFIAMSS